MNLTGKIFKGIGGFYYVHTPAGDYECRAKGIFRNRKEKPLVGDMAEIETVADSEKENTGNVVKILPRRNQLLRPEVSNIDQAVVIFALRDPAPSLSLLDRFLITMDQKQIPVVIIFNKNDLVHEDAGEGSREERVVSIYRTAGYEVHVINTKTDTYIPEIFRVLHGKTSVLSGPSGVGKSSLINRIHPAAGMEGGELSRKIDRGKNTTRHSEFFYIDDDTYVMDTPGFTSLYVQDIEPERLMYYYPEFEAYRNACRFNTCVHIGERDCAVKKAVQEGRIAGERYQSYTELYQELKEQKRY